jgi:hypothetical protein
MLICEAGVHPGWETVRVSGPIIQDSMLDAMWKEDAGYKTMDAFAVNTAVIL